MLVLTGIAGCRGKITDKSAIGDEKELMEEAGKGDVSRTFVKWGYHFKIVIAK